MADTCGHILTEGGDRILCENEDHLVTECFTGSDLMPGKVWKGRYPYWKPRRDPIRYRPPYSPPEYSTDEEEALILFATDID